MMSRCLSYLQLLLLVLLAGLVASNDDLVAAGGFFHAYAPSHALLHLPAQHHAALTKKCKAIYNKHIEMSNTTYFREMVRSFKLWPGLTAATAAQAPVGVAAAPSRRVAAARSSRAATHNAVGGGVITPSSTVFGFPQAISTLYAHQHPKNCSQARFFVSSAHNSGFGSSIHVYGAMLGLAVEMGRVYLQNPFPHPSATWETDNAFCGRQLDAFNRSKRSIECYYEATSSCSLFDALGPAALDMLATMQQEGFRQPHCDVAPFRVDFDVQQFQRNAQLKRDVLRKYDAYKVVVFVYSKGLRYQYLPSVFLPIVRCSPLAPTFQYYWWRAVATAFLLRPNRRSLAWVDAQLLPDFDEQASRAAVGVYIRRGDKAIEMQMVAIDNYTAAVDLLWSRGYLPSGANTSVYSSNKYNNSAGSGLHSSRDNSRNASLQARRVVYVASEDSQAISAMSQWSQTRPEYSLRFTEVFSRAGLFAEKNHTERQRLKQLAKHDPKQHGHVQEHHPEEYLNMLLQLQYLLRGRAFVCTLASNFCRVVDELRATVAGKADHPYVDLSVETCGDVPCVYFNMTSFSW